MWIEKTKSGSLRAVERYQVDGRWKRVSVPISKDTAQARRKAQEALEAKIKAIGQPINEKPLKELVELYLKKKKYKDSTYITISRQLNRAIAVTEDVPLEAGAINRAFMESNRSPSALNRDMGAFRTFLRWLFRYGYIYEDIAAKVHPVDCEPVQTSPEEKYLEPEELQAVLDQLSGMVYYMTKFLALTGCRAGEAAALNVGDIDDRYVHITKTYSSMVGMGTPKTRASARDVYIQPELKELLTEYKEWRLIHMMAYGIRTDILFFTQIGTRFTTGELGWYYNRLESKKHIHAHIFRHTHTALLAAQGVSLEAISRRLGHEDSKMTREVYYHVTERQKQKDEAALAAVRIL